MPSNKIFTFDYFCDEFKRFWDMCGDAKMDVERLQRAFNGLAFVATSTIEEHDRVTHLLTLAGINYERRLPYFIMKRSPMPTSETTISLHNSCRAVWVCKRCGNCARHCKHDDPANFHEDLNLPCSGPCQCIDCVPIDAPVNVELFRIKPLEWEENPMGEYFYTQPLGERSITYWVYRDCWFSTLTPTRTVASPEEGKQLAEQHWQEYIKQALVPVETKQ